MPVCPYKAALPGRHPLGTFLPFAGEGDAQTTLCLQVLCCHSKAPRGQGSWMLRPLLPSQPEGQG